MPRSTNKSLIAGLTVIALLTSLLATASAAADTTNTLGSDLAGAAGTEQTFVLDVPPGTTALEVAMTGQGDADLYVRFGSQPTLSDWQCRPYLDLTSTEQCAIDAPQAGEWHVLVHGYRAFSDVAVTGTLVTPTAGEQLTNGDPALDLAGVRNDEFRYEFSLPAGAANLNVTMTGAGDADLFVHPAVAPTQTRWTCRPYVDQSSTESCLIAEPQSGTWHVMVHGYASFSDVSLTATWDTATPPTPTPTPIPPTPTPTPIPPTPTPTPTPEPVGSECVSAGTGFAYDTGLKTWCWENVLTPASAGENSINFSNGELKTSIECDQSTVTNVGDQLRFEVTPRFPVVVPGTCNNNFNMRSEIRTGPWPNEQGIGTEEWFGWDYTFGDGYQIDQANEWLLFQMHPGVVGLSPHLALWIVNDAQMGGGRAGELVVVNNGNYPDYHGTNITPAAGDTLDIVIHIVYGDATNGELRVWINGEIVYDKQVGTVYEEQPWGGNAKWGIYKWPWRDETRIEASEAQGITTLETFMGSLRVLTRTPDDPAYGIDAYDLVAPR